MFVVSILYLLPFIIYLILSVLSDPIFVNTEYGWIQGSQTETNNRFVNIPFAKSPSDSLRFMPPQTPDSWDNDTFMANADYIIECPQFSFGDTVMQEDCLIVNVYSPLDAEEGNTNYAVLIWIYGGGFMVGSSAGQLYDPSNMVNYIGDIIVVTFNYRVALLGALYDNMYDTGVEGTYIIF